jgi:GAF domain-containing protein
VIADAPIVHFQVALVRARLADSEGNPEESRRQVLGALQLAAQHGWVNQPRRVRAEFGQTVRAIAPRADRSGSGPDRTRSDRTRSDRSGDTPWQQESPRSPQLLHDRRNLDALLAVHTVAAQQREPEAIAKVALDQAIGLLGAERGIWFTEARDGSLVVGAARDTDGNDLAVTDDYASTVVGQVRDELRPIVVTGTREGAAIGSESAVLHDLRSIMAAPLVQEGAFMGVVYLDSRLAKGVFTDDDLTMLTAIGSHIAVSMTTLRAARLESAVAAEQQERHLAQAIQDFTSEINASLDPAEVAERAGEAARRLLPFDQSRVSSTGRPS